MGCKHGCQGLHAQRNPRHSTARGWRVMPPLPEPTGPLHSAERLLKDLPLGPAIWVLCMLCLLLLLLSCWPAVMLKIKPHAILHDACACNTQQHRQSASSCQDDSRPNTGRSGLCCHDLATPSKTSTWYACGWCKRGIARTSTTSVQRSRRSAQRVEQCCAVVWEHGMAPRRPDEVR